jgi:hypothetical protein
MSVKVQQVFSTPSIDSVNEFELQLKKWLKPDSGQYEFAKQLYALDMIDAQGIARKELLFQPLSAIIPEEIQTIIDFLKKEICFVSRDGSQELLHSNLFDLYKNYCNSISHSSVRPELIGGAVPYVLAGYFRRVFAECGIVFSDEIKKVFDELDTAPADVDCRFTVGSDQFDNLERNLASLHLNTREQLMGLMLYLQPLYGKEWFANSQNAFCQAASSLQVIADTLRSDILRIKYFLLETYTNEFTALLTKGNDKGVDWIKKNGFKDFCHPFPESNKHLVIMSVKGKSDDIKYDTVIAEKIPRRHLFSRDAISLPLDSLFQDVPRAHLCSDLQIPGGKVRSVHGWQAIIDRLLKVIRIDDINSVDEFGWIMLQVYKAKGYTVLGYQGETAEQIEQALLKKLMPFDYVRTGDKLLRAWENRFHKDPEALYKIALHACQSFPDSVALWNYLINKSTESHLVKSTAKASGSSQKKGLDLPAFERIKKLAFGFLESNAKTDFSPFLTIATEMANGQFFEQAGRFLEELSAKSGITSEKLARCWDSIATIKFEQDVQKVPVAQLLETLKKRWAGKISAGCYNALTGRIVGLFLSDKPEKGYELLKSWGSNTTFSEGERVKLEKVLTSHFERMQKERSLSGLVTFLKIPCIEAKFPVLYERILKMLIAQSESASHSIRLEVVIRGFEASFIDRSLITLLQAAWPLPSGVIEKLSRVSKGYCQKLKDANDAYLLLDFARYLDLCKIEIPEEVLWAADEVSKSAALSEEDRHSVVHFFTKLLLRHQAPSGSIGRVMSLCTIAQAVTLLQAAAWQVDITAWLELQKRAQDDPIFFLNEFGRFLLNTSTPTVDFAPWFEQDGSLAVGVELLKKQFPATASCWKAIFTSTARCTKKSHKSALYELWKEKGSDFFQDFELQRLSWQLMADSAHADCFDWLRLASADVDPDLALSVYQAAVTVCKSCPSPVEMGKIEVVDTFRERVAVTAVNASTNSLDIDLIRILVASSDYTLLTKALERTSALLLQNPAFASNRHLIQTFSRLPILEPALMSARCAELMSGLSQTYPQIISLPKAFTHLCRTQFVDAGCRVLAAALDSACDLETDALYAFLEPLVQDNSKNEVSDVILRHAHLSKVLSKKMQSTLWGLYLKQILSNDKSLRSVETHRTIHLYFMQNFERMQLVSDELMYEVLQLAFDSVIDFLARYSSEEEFIIHYEALFNLIAAKLQLKTMKAMSNDQKVWIYIFASQSTQGTKGRLQEIERLFRLNGLFLQSILKADYRDKGFQLFAGRLAHLSLDFLMRTKGAQSHKLLLTLFEKYFYYIPVVDQQFYVDHMQKCCDLYKAAVANELFGPGNIELMGKIFENILYLNLEVVTYRPAKHTSKTALGCFAEQLKPFFMRHIDERYPFSVWRGIFMLNAAFPYFVEHSAYESFEACYMHLFKAALKIPLYHPKQENFSNAMLIAEKYHEKSNQEIASLFADSTQYSFDDKLIYLFGDVPVVKLLSRFANGELSFLNSGIQGWVAVPDEVVAKMQYALAGIINERADLEELRKMMQNCSL